MKIKKIYFDMDGVLADFNRGIKELCNMEPLDQKTAKPGDDDKMWERVKAAGHFYDKLEPMEGAVGMFSQLHDMYGDACEILSAVPKPKRGIVTAEEDKINWAHRVLSESLKVNIVVREEKKNYCTGPDCILIDDLWENIDEWNKNGGTGIHFDNAKNVLAKIKELSEK